MSFCLSVCASVDIWAANIRSHFRFQLSVQKLWIPSPQLRIILENGLTEQPRCMSRGIWFTSLVLMYWRKGAGMGCECCCHCFIRHVKTSSHRNKLLSQHPGLITPRIPARGSRGRGSVIHSVPQFQHQYSQYSECLFLDSRFRGPANQSAWSIFNKRKALVAVTWMIGPKTLMYIDVRIWILYRSSYSPVSRRRQQELGGDVTRCITWQDSCDTISYYSDTFYSWHLDKHIHHTHGSWPGWKYLNNMKYVTPVSPVNMRWSGGSLSHGRRLRN